jgi:two-component system response regulator FixJ
MIIGSFALIHIVDDDELIRASVSYLFSNHGYSTEIYTGGTEFFRDCKLKRGCIFLDVRMPQMSGYEVLEELARRGNMLPVVMLSAYGDFPAVVRAMKLGATDFVEKSSSQAELLGAAGRALASAGTGGSRRGVVLAAAARLSRLSPRQKDILQGLLDGLSNKGIARRLGLSPRTVEMHRYKMKRELGFASLSETVQFAIDAAMIPAREVVRYEMNVAGGFCRN